MFGSGTKLLVVLDINAMVLRPGACSLSNTQQPHLHHPLLLPWQQNNTLGSRHSLPRRAHFPCIFDGGQPMYKLWNRLQVSLRFIHLECSVFLSNVLLYSDQKQPHNFDEIYQAEACVKETY